MAAEWGYGADDGPSTWTARFKGACGPRQSPVAIVTKDVQFEPKLNEKPLKTSYNKEVDMCIGNTGASMKADTAERSNSTLTGGPLGDKVYKLSQFHIHWGATDDKGAEHSINGKVYSAELHLVHWNSTDYSSFDEALNMGDGLAVLGMFIKVGKAHKGFEVVSRELANITFKGKTCKAKESFDPTCLLPGNMKHYWTYPGSLTTPPCCESVQFILFEEVIEFSADQMKALRSLRFGGEGSGFMVNNFRPCCPLGSRKVQASFSQSP